MAYRVTKHGSVRMSLAEALLHLQVEIYCERLKDLLNTDSEELAIGRDAVHGCHVSGARRVTAGSSNDLMTVLHQGLENRVCRALACRM
jgi:Kinesin motor domain